MRLENKVAIVTGALGGLGRAIVEEFAAQGASVLATDLDTAEVGTSWEKLGDRVVPVDLDVTEEAQWQAAFALAEKRLGTPKILVNNAGIDIHSRPQDPEHATLEDWKRIFAVNVDGTFLGCRIAIPAFARAGGGSIINIASIAAQVATPMFCAYGASKAAVRQLTMSVAHYCATQHNGVRCNSIHPGIVETRLVQQFWRKMEREGVMSFGDARESFRQRVPTGTFAAADDIAAGAIYLASDESGQVTGSQLVIDGGITLNG